MIRFELTAANEKMRIFSLIIIFLIIAFSCAPPKMSLRERYVRETPGLKPEIRQAILDGDIIIGMTKEHVYASRATPIFKGEKWRNDETYEYWTYPDMKDSPFINIYFSDNVVVEIEKIDEEPSVE